MMRLIKPALGIAILSAALVGGFLCFGKNSHFKGDDGESDSLRMYLDLGTVPMGSSDISHTFLWKNDTSLPVRVIRSITSCGCTSVQMSPEVVRPGGFAKVSMLVDVRGRYGSQHFTAQIVTDSPDYPNIAAELDLVVPDPFKVSPEFLDFGSLAPNEERISWVNIVGPKEGFELRQISELPENIHIATENHDPSGDLSTVRLKITIRGLLQPRQEVVMLTMEAIAPGIAPRRVVIPTHGRYSGALRVNPGVLSLRADGDSCSEIVIESDGADMPIVSVDSSSSLTLEMDEPTRTDKGWRRRVRVHFLGAEDRVESIRTEQLTVTAGAVSIYVPVVCRQ